MNSCEEDLSDSISIENARLKKESRCLKTVSNSWSNETKHRKKLDDEEEGEDDNKDDTQAKKATCEGNRRRTADYYKIVIICHRFSSSMSSHDVMKLHYIFP
ncbi:hypothetical protein AVEN_17191-1 [Araneus ventricosus]|uniref:Uncharacterized protein n=1 Tax=Araneus ventricosus TaxID=182803 RepID=A0A4Y2DRF1_ARAVE|nr:hypothetical protein AVEN_17191-1 [Araneus ventricosus]